MLQYNMSREQFHSWFWYDRKIFQGQMIIVELTVLDSRYLRSLCDHDENDKPEEQCRNKYMIR